MKKLIKCVCVILLLCLSYSGTEKEAQAASYNEVVVEGGYRFLLYYTQASNCSNFGAGKLGIPPW